MRLAAVDIGSNTVHSLVADVVRGKLEDVAHYVEEPELGPYVARTGAIGSRSKVAIQALRSVVERARSHSFDVLIAGATQAVRQATDRDAFVREAGRAIGVPVHVIPAQREAELSFLGVASRHAVRREWAMVDLGGGSTEVVIGQGQAMVRSTTLPIRSGALARTYPSHPPRPQQPPAIGPDHRRPAHLRGTPGQGTGGRGRHGRQAPSESGQGDAGRGGGPASAPGLVRAGRPARQPPGPAARDAPGLPGTGQ